MLKLLIVDDERVPREGMVTLVPWKDYGIQVIATAADGQDALQKIEEEAPDIVLTDIKMPRMDGIALVKTLHEQRPEIDSLIISGYDEFEYAQKAINYGVKGYILKPIDPVELLHAVLQTAEQRSAAMACKTREDDVNAYLRSMIYACYTPEQMEEATSRFAGINGQWFRVMILQLENIRDAIIEQSGSLYSKLVGQMEGFQRENGSFHVVERSPNNMTFVFSAQDKQTVAEDSRRFLETVVNELKQVRYAEFVIGVSGYSGGIEHLAEQYLSTLRIMNLKYIYGSGRVYYAEKQYELTALEHRMESITSRAAELAFQNEMEAAARLMNEQYHAFRKEKTCLSDVQAFARNLLHAIIEKAGDYDLDVEDVYEDSHSMIFSICTSDSRREIMARLMEFMKTVGGYVKQHRSSTPEQICQEVQGYIRSHYDNPEMSTRTIAEAFHFNASYLSSVFSSKSRTTVTNYINTVRMEQACVFLRASDMKINQIAERVGFIHPTYFCTVFKREIGVSPSDYRLRM